MKETVNSLKETGVGTLRLIPPAHQVKLDILEFVNATEKKRERTKYLLRGLCRR